MIACCLILGGCNNALPSDVEVVYHELPEKVDFNFHIQPLLSDRCYTCHGPDEATREADLRLDLESEAFAKLKESGGYAFVGGNPGASVAWQRIISDDVKEQMPPPESHLHLTAQEKALIHKWIDQGAEWKNHWAFTPPVLPAVPSIDSGRVYSEIDQFILDRVGEVGMNQSPEAAPARLIRRVSFDLTGLPPSPEEVDAFMSDHSAEAYDHLVDKLLATDAYAERMAMEWLDVARFGDTQGLHWDSERFNWPWRDWVINAFKKNMPYDEFILEQMAGDLLPNATRDHKLATAFHRNNPTTSEGGVAGEEYRQKYVQDRINTTATAFLGLTLECATCHDHKFDPISQKEYFQMAAFFNNLKEVGMVNEFLVDKGGGPVTSSGPVLLLPDPETEELLTTIDARIQEIESLRAERISKLEATKSFVQSLPTREITVPVADAVFSFEKLSPHPIEDNVIHRIQALNPINQMVDGNSNSLACGDPQIVPGKRGNAIRSEEEMDMVFLKEVGTFEANEPYSAGAWMMTEKSGENQSLFGTSGTMGNAWRGWDFFLDTLDRLSIKLASIEPHNYIQITATKPLKKDRWYHTMFTYDGTGKADGLALYVDGTKVPGEITYDNLYGTIIHRWKDTRPEWTERPVIVFHSGRYHTGENGVFKGSIDEINIFREYLSAAQVQSFFRSQNEDQPLREISDADRISHQIVHHDLTYESLIEDQRKLVAERLDACALAPEIMVMEEMPQTRPTFVLDRGQYDAPTEQVYPGTPSHILEFSDELPKNRLGLAKWMLDKENPLTARVAVNRYWQMIFGRGLVATPDDFGIQGALPSHPELLDWLTIKFVDSGWDVAELLRLLVTSATYRQSSQITTEHRAKDPLNIHLARAPSYRMQAEMIRDNALAASGLLTRAVGGPSVKPYQPENIWSFSIQASGPYVESEGADLYRRSLYTYIRRTAPHPAMTAFDAPNRLVCTPRRELTNTPLQALVLLNDPQFVEASRVLAGRMLEEAGPDVQDQASYGFDLLCGRAPTPQELDLLLQQYNVACSKFAGSPKSARELLEVGKFEWDTKHDDIEVAAMTMLANTMMNFDEAYMKR